MVLRGIAAALLVVACAAGWVGDRPAVRPPIELGGYRVVAADFHIHSSTWSDGTLTPWGLVLQAERDGLDAIAITAHQEVADGKVARWFSRFAGGPTVLTGQEIIAPDHHVIAVGTDSVIDSRLSVAAQIDEVHRQGGIAIAAHPVPEYWPAFDEAALARLDGAEVCHPLVYTWPKDQQLFAAFAARGSLAAIGSSDFHGFGRMGICRTYVFARENSAPAILEAIRAHRTVVYGLGGRAFGDPALIALAATRPDLRDAATSDPPASTWDWISRVAGLSGLVAVAAASRARAMA
jgi:hypothetical protein